MLVPTSEGTEGLQMTVICHPTQSRWKPASEATATPNTGYYMEEDAWALLPVHSREDLGLMRQRLGN